jgi:predicted AAA+ superfamily ATPase
MATYIQRTNYLQKLINRMDNGEVKIITGSRRSGKSWLLSHIFYDYLLSQGVDKNHIIHISFDVDDEVVPGNLLEVSALKSYLYDRILDDKHYYIMLDEIQEVEGFERLINGLNTHENIDIYITGSNSKFLSSDIRTIFRGRGDEIHVYPLSFSEFCEGRTESISELWKEYYTYGGLPALRNHRTAEQKFNYLQRLWQKTYLADVIDRHGIKNIPALEALTDVLCSSVGSLTNPMRLSNTILSVMHVNASSETIAKYIQHLENSFLFEGVSRYNIKGKRYFESIKKYYSVDIGLRNARLNFRQQELPHIMENVIYNHLRIFGYLVDVGVIEKREMRNGQQQQSQYEVDFIATNGFQKLYIQSAYRLDTDDKKEQELKSLRNIDDSFRKIVIVGDDIATYTDEEGITYMGLFQFLLHGFTL